MISEGLPWEPLRGYKWRLPSLTILLFNSYLVSWISIFNSMDVHNSNAHSATYTYAVDSAEPPPSSDSTCTTMHDQVWIQQVLPTSWVNRKRLLQKLRNRFGDNNFRVEVRQQSGESFQMSKSSHVIAPFESVDRVRPGCPKWGKIYCLPLNRNFGWWQCLQREIREICRWLYIRCLAGPCRFRHSTKYMKCWLGGMQILWNPARPLFFWCVIYHHCHVRKCSSNFILGRASPWLPFLCQILHSNPPDRTLFIE